MKSKRENKNTKQVRTIVKEPGTAQNNIQTRREFLGNLWKGLGIVAAAEFAAVFFGFLFSGKNDEEKTNPKQLFDAGSAESFNNNSVTIFRGGRFYLVRLSDGGFLALSLRCTHLGCSINWEDVKKRFICPCHSSAFYINGEVQNPPAPSALDYYPVIIENGRVKVDIGSKLKRTGFSKNQAAYV